MIRPTLDGTDNAAPLADADFCITWKYVGGRRTKASGCCA